MSQENIDKFWLEKCLGLAQRASDKGEVPVGAIIVDNRTNKMISKAFNLRESLQSPLAHAEVLAIHRACRKLGQWRLTGHTLYTNLEPCVMCSGVILQARLDRVSYSSLDPKGGGHSLFSLLDRTELNHRPIVHAGILGTESQGLIQKFFKELRKKTKPQGGSGPEA